MTLIRQWQHFNWSGMLYELYGKYRHRFQNREVHLSHFLRDVVFPRYALGFNPLLVSGSPGDPIPAKFPDFPESRDWHTVAWRPLLRRQL